MVIEIYSNLFTLDKLMQGLLCTFLNAALATCSYVPSVADNSITHSAWLCHQTRL